ncbi:DUF6596 domain-containing protein [Micromonospora gifhornensis]|uniref:DUF6596 domain-containing protein n=1 Tax=Micromonospora gifhornensis TaxID=84594 RepID=A0ABQ4IJY3_9ACTN|nr:DUF6596 domain-containing protein [Micromonospora gifhornensis]GIJ18218.1 hypothetical protein Vgi01_49020 [Micromonospora gifhornensis]
MIYLVFNEGYLSSSRSAQRRELAREGVELARQLAELLPGEPEADGLAALLELHQARAAARFDSWGRIVLLDKQDRRRWDRPAIERAALRLRAAVRPGRTGPYQLQAGIAALQPDDAADDLLEFQVRPVGDDRLAVRAGADGPRRVAGIQLGTAGDDLAGRLPPDFCRGRLAERSYRGGVGGLTDSPSTRIVTRSG